MRHAIALGGLAAVLVAGVGCKSHIAGRCDCTNHPESAVLPPTTANYPILGAPQTNTVLPMTAAPAPAAVGPSGVMGGAPMTMPAPDAIPVAPMK